MKYKTLNELFSGVSGEQKEIAVSKTQLNHDFQLYVQYKSVSKHRLSATNPLRFPLMT